MQTQEAGRAARIRRIVCDVVAAAVRDAGAGGIVVLDDWTPEGGLVHDWLTAALGSDRVWRVSALAANIQTPMDPAEARVVAAWRAVRERAALVAHPLNRTALLLGGAPPMADLLPLGDLYASQVEALTGDWSAPDDVAAAVAAAGGPAALDAALQHWLDTRMDAATALAPLGPELARQVAGLNARGRHFRLRPRLVPKLGTRTVGIDLWD